MKGIVLAGGKGSRINAITNGGSKCLLNVNDKSLVSHNVANLCALNEIDECIVVVGYNADAVIQNLGYCCNGKQITYCFQKEQKGLIDALESALDKLKGNDFFMVLGDEIVLHNCYREALENFKKENISCLIGVIEVDNISLVKKTYTFELDQDKKMHSFIEKPTDPFNCYMGTGNVIFRKEVLDLLVDIPVNPIRGEKELVDMFNVILDKGGSIGSFIVGDAYFNVNTLEDYDALKSAFSI